MAWIESHQTLGRHPKLIRLAGKLRIHRAQALGHLQYLWWWALDYAPTGDISALAPAEISAASEWQGDPSLFQESLVECGWIDSDGMIHDWMEYAGRLIEERKRDAERKRLYRMSSAGRPPDGGRTAPVPNPTVPNPTQPNPTKNKPCLPGWDIFWEKYPRKTAKQAAMRAFAKLSPTNELLESILGALESQKKSDSWVRDGGAFIPHPATWLNGRRWEDEISQSPPKPGDEGYQATDADRVIAAYRNAKGIPKDDVQWRTIMWEKQRKDAGLLLEYFKGDWRGAVRSIDATSERCKNIPAGWSWPAVMNTAASLKNGVAL